MRALTAGTNIDEATTDYPNGRVRDKSGSTEGTLLNEVLVGDFIQFLQKLVIDSGIVVNNLPDNVTNGYQLLIALVAKISEISLAKDNIEEYEPDGDYNPATKKFVVNGGETISFATISPVASAVNTTESVMIAAISNQWIYINGKLRLDSSVSENEVLYTLPSTFPTFSHTFYFSAGDGGTGDDNIELKALAGTRNIVAGEQTSEDATASFNEAFLNID